MVLHGWHQPEFFSGAWEKPTQEDTLKHSARQSSTDMPDRGVPAR